MVLKAMLRKFSIFEYVGDFSNLRTKVYERGPLLIVGLIREPLPYLNVYSSVTPDDG